MGFFAPPPPPKPPENMSLAGLRQFKPKESMLPTMHVSVPMPRIKNDPRFEEQDNSLISPEDKKLIMAALVHEHYQESESADKWQGKAELLLLLIAAVIVGSGIGLFLITHWYLVTAVFGLVGMVGTFTILAYIRGTAKERREAALQYKNYRMQELGL